MEVQAPLPDFALAKIQPPRPRIGLIERPALEAALGRALVEERYLPVVLEHDRQCMEQQIEWVPTVFAGETKIIEGAFSFAEFTAVMKQKVLSDSKTL